MWKKLTEKDNDASATDLSMEEGGWNSWEKQIILPFLLDIYPEEHPKQFFQMGGSPVNKEVFYV